MPIKTKQKSSSATSVTYIGIYALVFVDTYYTNKDIIFTLTFYNVK